MSARASRLGTVVAAVLIPLVFVVWRPDSAIFLASGGLGWVLAVAVKRRGFEALGRLPIWTRLNWRAAIVGAWSALCELGVAAALLTTLAKPPGLVEATAFGVGAACVEALYLAWLAFRQRRPARDPVPGNSESVHSHLIQHMFAVERTLAGATHVVSRILVYDSLRTGTIGPELCAFVAFSLVDGAAMLGHGRRWNWFDLRVARRYYGFLAVIVATQTIAIFLFRVSHLR